MSVKSEIHVQKYMPNWTDGNEHTFVDFLDEFAHNYRDCNTFATLEIGKSRRYSIQNIWIYKKDVGYWYASFESSNQLTNDEKKSNLNEYENATLNWYTSISS